MVEQLDLRVLLELLDRKVRLDLRERLFLDQLDQLVLQARQDLLETREPLAAQDHKAHLGHLVLQVRRDPPALKEILVTQVHLDHKVQPDFKVCLDHQALDGPVLQDQQVQLEIRAVLVRPEILELLELLVHQVSGELLEPMELLAQPDLPEPQDYLVRVAHLEQLAPLVPLDL